jgi:L-threonylcarbamoyladenylate synthase
LFHRIASFLKDHFRLSWIKVDQKAIHIGNFISSDALISKSDACKILKKGGIVALPTETVYGLAGDACQDSAVREIYRMKGRPLGNPLIVHYPHQQAVMKDVIWTPQAEKWAQLYWPGPLTLVLERAPGSPVSFLVSANQKSVAVRVPSHPLFQEILHLVQKPLAAPSANPSGKRSPTRFWHVLELFKETVPVLPADPCSFGLESTVLDVRGAVPILLRPGALNLSLSLSAGHFCTAHDQGVVSPGLLSAHYAPLKPLRMNAVTLCGESEGLMAFGPVPEALLGARWQVQLSEASDLEEAAYHFFDLLSQIEKTECESIAVMPIPPVGVGIALNDRLARASYEFRQ